MNDKAFNELKKKKTIPSEMRQNPFRMKDGQPIEIPPEGALGLLALGDVGLVAWRQKRQQL